MLALLFSPLAQAGLPQLGDWPALARQSAAQQRPILLMFARSDCDYCERLEQQQLLPLQRSSEGTRVILRKHTQDLSLPPIVFAGQRLYGDDFALHFGIKITPTVLLLNAQGVELERLVGYNGSDFYSARLEQAIDRTSQRLAQEEK